MGVIFQDTLIADTVFIILPIFACIYIYMLYLFTYWKRRNVPYCTPSFPFGNVGPILRLQKHFSVHYADLYNKLNERFFGIYVFGKPTLIIKDPELIKSIMVKDYSHFQGRGVQSDGAVDPLNANLFRLSGEQWKQRRVAISPAFTSGKLKVIINTVLNCGEELQKHLQSEADTEQEIDMRDLSARYTTDIIASVAFGTSVNSVAEPNHEFRKMGRRIFEFNKLGNVILILSFISPGILNRFNVRSSKPDVETFFRSLVQQTVDYRENNKVSRKDFIQLLLQLRNSGKINEDDSMDLKVNDEKKFSLDEMTAECFIFFLAAFETSSVAISLTLFELALNPVLRKKVQEEIDLQVGKHKGFSYEAMMDMKYLDTVISETMRKYPALGFIPRQCTHDYKIPDSDVVIEKGTSVVIPLFALHRDPKYFPNPEKYDPDRFKEDVKPTWPPYAYMPFGEGPRACIGMRLGKMQVKIGLSMMLQKYDFEPCSRTPAVIIPDVKSLGVSQKGGMFLKVLHRKH